MKLTSGAHKVTKENNKILVGITTSHITPFPNNSTNKDSIVKKETASK